MDGAGSSWTNTGSLTVGNQGTGTLTVSNGGVVSASNMLIANMASSTGTLNIGAAFGLVAGALKEAAKGAKDPVIAISADAAATHQAVVNVMESARLAGYNHISFTTQTRR